MADSVAYRDVTIESVDRAVKSWFERTVAAQVEVPDDLRKDVPVVFSSGERWAIGRTRGSFRDSNGVLILPVISIRRVNLEKDPSKTALGVQTPGIQIAKRVDPKSNAVRNLGWKGSVYDVYTIPYPDGMVASYQLVIQTQYITQMNVILQKLFRSLDIQRQFVAPLDNDGRSQTPRSVQSQGIGERIAYPYVVGFFENALQDAGNFEEFTDQERIIKYQTGFTVPFVMQTSPDGQAPSVRVERTAFRLSLGDEQCHFVDDPAELDEIFGPKR